MNSSQTIQKKSDEKCTYEGYVVTLKGTKSEFKNPNAFNLFLAKAQNFVESELGAGWVADQDEDDFNEFDLIPDDSVNLTNQKFWDTFYKLQEHKDIDDIEAIYETTLEKKASEEIDIDDESEGEPAPESTESTNSNNIDKVLDWHLIRINAFKAWEKSKGEGIRIGHPDTGLREHKELFEDNRGVHSPRLKDDLGWDFIANNDSVVSKKKIANHGLSTGSVITSYDNIRPKERVHGVAPRAELLPMRVTNFQVLGGKGLRRVKQAIKRARDNGCHVVSISLGSPLLSTSLQNEAARAVNQGIILLAAAGNGLKWIQPPVVYPARYPEFIAVAACNKKRKPWKKSSRGPEVEVTAPGQWVWRARVINKKEKVKPGSGTSYSVAIVAGVAALWLSFHGVANLRHKYRRIENGRIVFDRIVYAFRKIVSENSDPSPHLDPNLFGAGIINADKVLKAPLPSPVEVDAFKQGLRNTYKGISDEDTLSTFGVTFPIPRSKPKTKDKSQPWLLWFNNIFTGENDEVDEPLTNKQIKQILARLFGVKVRNLSKILLDIGEELSLQFILSEELYDLFTEAARNKSIRTENLKKIKEILIKKDLSQKLKDEIS